MAINQDFRDLFAALNDANAKYLMVGGYALSFHAQPRFTKDLDIWIEPGLENAKFVFQALGEFGAPLQNIAPQDLAPPDLIFQIGMPPNRIDVITSIDGVEFIDAWPSRVQSIYGDVTINIIGRDHLIQNKRASGRPQDLIDVELLEQHS